MTHRPLALGFVAAAVLLAAGCATDGGIDRENAAAANANVGADYLHKGENDRAQRAFKKALSYDKDNFAANWGMAVVSDRLHSPDQARDYFQKTLHIRSAPAIYNSYAAFLCEQGDTEQGVAYFNKALATSDAADRADTLANAGLCLYRAKQVNAAADYFHRALKIDPRQGTALTRLATIAYHARNYLSARAFIERADAATTLDSDQLLLAARIELALNDRDAAESYVKRHNADQTTASASLKQLESSRQ